MSSRLLPPPPLIAPTPSKVRPVADPLMVIVVAACAGVAGTAAPSEPSRTAATSGKRRLYMGNSVQGLDLEFGDLEESGAGVGRAAGQVEPDPARLDRVEGDRGRLVRRGRPGDHRMADRNEGLTVPIGHINGGRQPAG